MVYWVMPPYSLVGYNVSEEAAASTFRLKVKMVKPEFFLPHEADR
jgi:hypothetical protein